jgi:hypothetical protein
MLSIFLKVSQWFKTLKCLIGQFWIKFQLLLCFGGIKGYLLNISLYIAFLFILKYLDFMSPVLTVAYCAQSDYEFYLRVDLLERVRVLEMQNLYGLPPQLEAGGYSNRMLSSLNEGNLRALDTECYQVLILEKEAQAQTLLVELANLESARVRQDYVSAGEINRYAFEFVVNHFHLFGHDFNYNVPVLLSPFEDRPLYLLQNRNLAADITSSIAELSTLGRSAPFYRLFRSYFTGEHLLGPLDEQGRRGVW